MLRGKDPTEILEREIEEDPSQNIHSSKDESEEEGGRAL